MIRQFLLLLILFVLAASSPVLAQDNATNATLSGLVMDSENGRPLFGASVLLNDANGNVVQGVVADVDGNFQISDIQPGEYQLQVSYIAYVGFNLDLSLIAGEVRTVNAVLNQERVNINTIVVTASRGAEKVLDSPASITVIDAQDVVSDVGFSTIGTLRNVTGVDLAQTSIDRSQIALRGFNAANINSNVFLLNDYRPALGSEGVAFYSIMSSSSIDLDRIEVVRGPASALYGAGGDAGVVHFISKNPFDYPGTSLALTGGSQSTLAGQYRHAGVLNQRFGYKITATFKKADEWAYDPENEIEAGYLSQEFIPRNNSYSKTLLNGMVQYRGDNDLTLTFNSGFSELTGFLLTEISPFQVDQMLGYYGQFRVQAGKFFGQAYANMREAGESFSYTAVRPIVQEGGRYGGQVQYDISSGDERSRFVIGADADMIRLESSGTLTGRNEQLDDITLLGGYAQTSMDISDEIDLTVALRGDWSNVYEGLQLSPRAALLYKPTSNHTFRASFNSAFAAPTTFQYFLDFVIQEQQLTPDGAMFLAMGRGGADAYTFEGFRENNSARMLLPVGNYLGSEVGINSVPLNAVYGAAVGGGLLELIQSGNPIPGLSVTPDQQAMLGNLLAQTFALGFGDAATDAGILGLPDGSETGFRQVQAPLDTEPLQQTTTQLMEVGYKGILGRQLLVAVDVYYANKKNFVGPLSLITPFVYLQQAELTGDLAASIGNLLATSEDATLNGLVTALGESGLSSEQVTGILANMVGQAMANQSVAVVQTDQEILQPGTENAVGALAAFRNFGNIDYWGADVSLEYYASSQLSMFGNVSIMGDDLFDNEELKEEDTSLELALNAPTFKAKMGLNYTFDGGYGVNIFSRYAKGFPVRSGRLIGEVEDVFLLDLGFSYDFNPTVPGLRFDLMVQNVLDNRHRQFIGAPRIGRVALARISYNFE